MDINILKNLDTKIVGNGVEYYEEIGSTHTYAKENVDEIKNGTIILAERQTAGKGTKGRKWYTGSGENIALTIVLKPNCHIDRISTLTIDVAKMIKKVIKDLYEYDLEIKEPNDLILNKKKIAGILIESVTLGNEVKNIILSVGFNVNEVNFDENTKDIATSLKREFKKDFSREEILLNILKTFDKYLYDIL